MTLAAALTHDQLNYAPLTATEREIVEAERQLMRQSVAAFKAGNYDLLADLMEEKHLIEERFAALRAHTWHRWMESEFPAAMAQYAGTRTA